MTQNLLKEVQVAIEHMLNGDCPQSPVNNDPDDRWYMTSSPSPYCWVKVENIGLIRIGARCREGHT